MLISSRRLRGERRRASQTDVRARVQSDPGGRVHASRLRASGRSELGASLSVWRRRRHPHSCRLAWRNPMDRGARRATVLGVAESRTRLKRLSTQRALSYCRFFQIIRGSGNEPLDAHSFASRCLNAVDPGAPVFPAWGTPLPPPPTSKWAGRTCQVQSASQAYGPERGFILAQSPVSG